MYTQSGVECNHSGWGLSEVGGGDSNNKASGAVTCVDSNQRGGVSTRFRVRVPLRLTFGQSVCLGVGPRLWLMTR
jgi:hypothetical protein